MLTISQLAAYAGVTVRAVRHYHQRGLLPEPERDHSGYRRYGAQDVIDLVRIRTLAAAGVPLADVPSLLAADATTFRGETARLDGELAARITELEQRRRDLAQLETPERLCLPEWALDIHDRMREIGLSERSLALDRESWILVAALYPELAKDSIAWSRRVLDDPEYVELLRAIDRAHHWSADDPRLKSLAERSVAMLEKHYSRADAERDLDDWAADQGRAVLVTQHNLDASPGWRRLAELVEERARELGYPMP